MVNLDTGQNVYDERSYSFTTCLDFAFNDSYLFVYGGTNSSPTSKYTDIKIKVINLDNGQVIDKINLSSLSRNDIIAEYRIRVSGNYICIEIEDIISNNTESVIYNWKENP